MTIEEAIANNFGSIITGSVAIIASFITGGVSIWISRANHIRNTEKEKKAALLSRNEAALKEVIRWRNAITLYVVYLKSNVESKNSVLSRADQFLEAHGLKLNDIKIDDLLISIKLCANEKFDEKYNNLDESYTSIMKFLLNYSIESEASELKEIQTGLINNINSLLQVIDNEIKSLIR